MNAIDKNNLRIKMRRRLMCHVQKCTEQEIAHKILLHPDIRDARSIFVYVSYGTEVPTHMLIEQLLRQGKIICVPHIINDGMMIPVRIRHLSQLKVGKYGIKTIASQKSYEGHCDVALVPGLAFDRDGNRLGKGGGYYDRFFAVNPPMKRIGLAWHSQCISHVPHEKHDYKMHRIVLV